MLLTTNRILLLKNVLSIYLLINVILISGNVFLLTFCKVKIVDLFKHFPTLTFLLKNCNISINMKFVFILRQANYVSNNAFTNF